MRYEYGAFGPRLVGDAGLPLLPPVPPAAARVTATWGAAPHPAREVVALADRLLALADQVAQLGYGGRHGPEDFVCSKLTAARELRALARELQSCR